MNFLIGLLIGTAIYGIGFYRGLVQGSEIRDSRNDS